MTDGQTRAAIHAYVRAAVEPRDVSDIGDDESLVDCGVADSLGVFRLVAFLERKFGIAIADDEIVQDNFRSVRAASALVSRKLAARDNVYSRR